MYKKITHNIVEEHFDHPAVLPPPMRSQGGIPPGWEDCYTTPPGPGCPPTTMPDTVQQSSSTQSDYTKTTLAAPELDTDAVYAFKCAVEKLWNKHSEYSRAAMISTLAGLDDFDAIDRRLMTNQENLGNAVASYYGTEAAMAFTSLLKDQITYAVDAFKAIKSDKSTTDLEASLAANADAIATFLDSADPVNWPKAVVLSVITALLASAIKQAKARYAKDWVGDIEANDASYDTTYALANTFSSGIINKFPQMFVKQYSSEPVKKN